MIQNQAADAAQNSSGVSLTLWKDIFTILGVLVAAGTFYMGYRGFKQQVRQKRYEYIKGVRDKASKDEKFQNIAGLLELDHESLKEVSLRDKLDFLSFYEEVALMVNSGFVTKEVAHYLFAKYLLLCWDHSEKFWEPVAIGDQLRGVDRDSKHWSFLEDFVEDMRTLEEEKDRDEKHKWIRSNKRKLRF